MTTYDNDREADKIDAQDNAAYSRWVAREIAAGHLAPAATWMPMSDVIWQWEQYTGLTAPKF